MSSMASNDHMLEILPASLWREHHAVNTLISDFWPPELQENAFLLL